MYGTFFFDLFTVCDYDSILGFFLPLLFQNVTVREGFIFVPEETRSSLLMFKQNVGCVSLVFMSSHTKMEERDKSYFCRPRRATYII